MLQWQLTRGLRALVLAALLACVAAVAACGGDDSGGSDTTAASQASSEVSRDVAATLRVATWPEWRELLEAADEFRAQYPNVDIKFQQVEQRYFDNLPQTLRSSDAPDITAVQMESGIGPWHEVREQRLVADLTEVWEDNRLESAYNRDTIEHAFAGDTPVALPMHTVWAPVIYYNRTLFEREGIEPPAGPVATLEEFDGIVEALDDAGIVPLVPGGIADDNGAAFLLGSLVQTSCGDDEYDNLVTNWRANVEPTTTWQSDCAVTALETLREWADSGVFGDSPATLKRAQALTLFAAGRAGMVGGGSWDGLTPTWRSNIPVGWFLLPPVGDAVSETRFQVTTGDGLAVTANGPNEELAKEFVKLVASRDFQSSDAYLQAPGGSPRSDIPAPPGAPELARSQQDARADVGDVEMMLNVPYAVEVFPELAKMIADERTPQQVAERFDALADEERRADARNRTRT